MQHLPLYATDVAIVLARLVLGILFLMQGYDKIFRLGLRRTGEGVAEAMRGAHLPAGFMRAVTAVSSFTELAGGLLLIAGFLTYPALYLLGLDLLVVVCGMSLREPLWDMRYVWPRFVLLLLLLLHPATAQRFTLDHFFHTYGN